MYNIQEEFTRSSGGVFWGDRSYLQGPWLQQWGTPVLRGQEQGRDAAPRCCAQSRKRWQAFFHRQAVHHWSRCSMPYTLRHFLASPRTFLQKGEKNKYLSARRRTSVTYLRERLRNHGWAAPCCISAEMQEGTLFADRLLLCSPVAGGTLTWCRWTPWAVRRRSGGTWALVSVAGVRWSWATGSSPAGNRVSKGMGDGTVSPPRALRWGRGRHSCPQPTNSDV